MKCFRRCSGECPTLSGSVDAFGVNVRRCPVECPTLSGLVSERGCLFHNAAWRGRNLQINVGNLSDGRRVNIIHSHLFFTISMAPYNRWVLPSFRDTLLNHCDRYLESSDRGNDKSRSKLIVQVAQAITDIAREKSEQVPDDLEKVVS